MTLNEFIGQTPNAVIGAETTAGANIAANWYASRVWFAPSQLPDFTNAGVLAGFVPAADLGVDGSTPTGVSPLVYLNGTAATYNANLGTGTDFTIVGALANAPSTPS